MAAQKHEIELLPREEWEKTPFGKFLNWTLTVGRYIVITTEFIVILAFLSRFKLDRDLTDLHEEIKSKQAIVEATSNFEKDFRFLQKRLTVIEKLEKNQLLANRVVEEIAQLTPLEVSLKDLTVEENRLTLTAIALSEQSLATFLKNLQASPQFQKISLTNVSSGTEKAMSIQFELESELNGS